MFFFRLYCFFIFIKGVFVVLQVFYFYRLWLDGVVIFVYVVWGRYVGYSFFGQQVLAGIGVQVVCRVSRIQDDGFVIFIQGQFYFCNFEEFGWFILGLVGLFFFFINILQWVGIGFVDFLGFWIYVRGQGEKISYTWFRFFSGIQGRYY